MSRAGFLGFHQTSLCYLALSLLGRHRPAIIQAIKLRINADLFPNKVCVMRNRYSGYALWRHPL